MNRHHLKFGIQVSALLLSLLFIYLLNHRQENFADQALGEETSRYLALKGKQPIHAVELDSSLLNDILRAIDTLYNTTLFLGNSQTHSINQMNPGEVNYIEILSKRVKSNILCQSIPNANLQEFLLLYNFWKDKTKITRLVVPVFMDDLREDGIRPFFINYLLQSKYLISDSSSCCKQINNELFELSKKAADATGTQSEYLTLQDKTEAKINQFLYENSGAWGQRENLRGNLFVFLYELRNMVFHINASTKRKMIPVRYASNLNALRQILFDSKQRNIQTLIYIPPIRHDTDIPYDSSEYFQFKIEIENLANQFRADFKNFEDIVPGPLWGYKASTNASGKKELDFMHFKAKGHQILADSLYKLINP
jgi:hypothetical protein